MIKIFDADKIKTEDILPRKIENYCEYEEVVRTIIADVTENGDAALFKYAQKFDGVVLSSLEVTKEEKDAAKTRIDKNLKEILERAAENIRLFHKEQVKKGFEIKKEDGIVLGQRYTPIRRAGIYVPGGTASYPSTVLMNAIPAKIAGVSEIIMVTPPMRDGKIKDEILVAAAIAGVDRIFKVGGAGAIAALAYGTESVPKVDKITGPGNIFVALAKKEVFGTVGIDMIAGPSEILVIADSSASAKCVAADMLSQAEHDRLASAVLICLDKEFAKAVSDEIEKQLAKLERKDIARASIDGESKIIVVRSMDRAAEISNMIAPEHLELYVEKPFEVLEKITDAGSVFLGGFAPEALGDYYAGPNHTLPTSGSAKFSSPLSVDDFVKKSSYIYYTKDALARAKDDVAAFAKSEGLDAHAKSVLLRFE